MRFKTMATITGVTFIAAGAAFILLEREMITLFTTGAEPPLSNSHRVFWIFRMRSFAILFGTSLLGCGLMTWAIRNLRELPAQTNAALALCVMNALIGGAALAQDMRFHQMTKAYGATSLVFFALALGWCWLLLPRLKRDADLNSRPAADTAILREQWAQQIGAAAAQQERNRLARELHDSIKQQLFSINISAATAQARWEKDESGARAALADVRGSVREAMAEMEVMLHNLRPVPVETVGLIEALRQQCEALQYRTGAQVTTEIGDLPPHEELPPGTQDAIFRITQEALANIARHARATTVRVRIYQQASNGEDALWLKIEDDGAGFDMVNVPAGMGLANIRARVSEIGGSLQLDSREGEGTSIVVCVPLIAGESDSIRRELHTALALALVGAFAGGLQLYYFTWKYWPVLAIPLLLSAFIYYRVARHLRSVKTGAKKARDLEVYWRQGRLVLQAMTAWVALRWNISANWHSRTKQVVFAGMVLLLWLSLYIYEMRRLHQLLKLQQVRLAPPVMRQHLQQMWRQASLADLLAFLIFGKLGLHWIEGGYEWQWEPTSIPLLLCLAYYWFYLAAWQLWQKRWEAGAILRRKESHDPSRTG